MVSSSVTTDYGGGTLHEVIQGGLKYLESKYKNVVARAEVETYHDQLRISVHDRYTDLHHNYAIDMRKLEKGLYMEAIKQLDRNIEMERLKVEPITTKWYDDLYVGTYTPTSMSGKSTVHGIDYYAKFQEEYGFKKKQKKKPKASDYKEVKDFGEF